jgi:hypothetical protein
MNTAGSDREYPGIGRLHYFLGNVCLIAAVVFVVAMFGPESPVMSGTSLVVMIGAVVLDVMRLRNIGVSQWLVFLRFVPFGSTVLAIGLLAAQTGWADTRRLDSAGRSILFAEFLLLALILFLAFRTGLTIFGF